MTSDPHTIAARLGIDELAIRRLQARGYLLRFDCSEADVRERLFTANVRLLSAHDAPPPPEGNRPRPAA